MHQKNEWDNCNFKVLHNFFFREHITLKENKTITYSDFHVYSSKTYPSDYDMLKILTYGFESFPKFFAFGIPIGPEKNDSQFVSLSISDRF